MNVPKIISLAWILVWTGLGLTSVYQPMKIPEPNEVYGWAVPFGLFMLTAVGVLAGYLWGKES